MLHISKYYIGPSAMFEPRLPHADDMFEGHLPPRICVSPTIFGCLMGVTGDNLKGSIEQCNKETFFIYKTKSKEYVEGIDIPDYFRTKEKYFTKPTEFHFIGKMIVEEGKILVE